MNYITGKQSQLILNITTRQGLNKIVNKHKIKIKSQGPGKANLYLESDVKNVAKKTNKQRLKTNPKLKKKIEVKKKVIKEKTEKQAKKKQVGFLNNNPLNPTGQEVFNFTRQELIDNGTYQEKDLSLLQSYCVSYQKYINAINQSALELDTTIDSFGNVKVNPYFTIADKCLSQMDKLAKALGLGAKNRVGLEIQKPKEKSFMDKMNTEEEF